MLFVLPICAHLQAQNQEFAPAETQPTSGSCTVSLGTKVFQRERCTLAGESGGVPNHHLLVIEHVSAVCSTTPERGIYTLALLASSALGAPPRIMMVPVREQTATQSAVRLSGSHAVRLYGGATTGVDVLLSTWESAPGGETSCDVSFSGVLKRVNPTASN